MALLSCDGAQQSKAHADKGQNLKLSVAYACTIVDTIRDG